MAVIASAVLLAALATMATEAFPVAYTGGPPRFPRPFADRKEVYCLHRLCDPEGPRLADCETGEVVAGHAAVNSQFMPWPALTTLTTPVVVFTTTNTTEQSPSTEQPRQSETSAAEEEEEAPQQPEQPQPQQPETTTAETLLPSMVASEEDEEDGVVGFDDLDQFVSVPRGMCAWSTIVRLFCVRNGVSWHECHPTLLLEVNGASASLCHPRKEMACEDLTSACLAFLGIDGKEEDYDDDVSAAAALVRRIADFRARFARNNALFRGAVIVSFFCCCAILAFMLAQCLWY